MEEKASTIQQLLLEHVGVNVETATLLGVWLAAFGIANRLLAGGRKLDEGRFIKHLGRLSRSLPLPLSRVRPGLSPG